MPFLIKYTSYPDIFSEVRMELGSPDQYQTIIPVERIVPFKEGEPVSEPEKEFDMLFKTVNNKNNSITSHTMTREELSEYIDILRKLLSQTK